MLSKSKYTHVLLLLNNEYYNNKPILGHKIPSQMILKITSSDITWQKGVFQGPDIKYKNKRSVGQHYNTHFLTGVSESGMHTKKHDLKKKGCYM